MVLMSEAFGADVRLAACAHFVDVGPLTACLATRRGGAAEGMPSGRAMQSARFIAVAFCRPCKIQDLTPD